MNIKKITLIITLFISIISINAQEIIKDSIKPKAITQRMKVDGIVATVGDYLVLDSDIDKSLLEISSQGGSIENITRCQMIGKLLEDRLYAHHAVQDSLKVTDAEVRGTMEDQIAKMIEYYGTEEKTLKVYKKGTLEELKSFLFEIMKLNKLSSEMQKKIVEDVKITPEEVRTFFKKFPTSELPQIGEEVEVAQIVMFPKVTQTEKQKVIDKLKGFKEEIQKGGSFSSKAVLYSMDPGSKSNGGYMKINRKTPLVKEFKDVAFSLNEGEISEPFETTYGYHIVFIEKIKGNDLEIRHILLMPKVTDDAIKEAKEELGKIRAKILSKEISFAEAARSVSEDKETKANGGILLNPKTMDSHFELTKMDPSLYSIVSNLKEGDISQPQLDVDQTDKKVIKLVTVTKKTPAHTADYSQDYLKIKEYALKDKQVKAVSKWMQEKIKETYIKVNGEYRDCPFANNWLKKI